MWDVSFEFFSRVEIVYGGGDSTILFLTETVVSVGKYQILNLD